MTGTNGNGAKIGTQKVKQGLAQMLKGGVIVSCLLTYKMRCFVECVRLDVFVANVWGQVQLRDIVCFCSLVRERRRWAGTIEEGRL